MVLITETRKQANAIAHVSHPTLDHKVDSLPLSLRADAPVRRVDVREGPSTTHDGEHIT